MQMAWDLCSLPMFGHLKKEAFSKDWLQQENLNIALTGICDVFDLHAEKGLEIARNGIRSKGASPNLPVKTVSKLPGNA